MVIGALCLLAGCASGPPERGAGYWAQFVKDYGPKSADSGTFYSDSDVYREVKLGKGSRFHFKFIETLNAEPNWVIEVTEDGGGYFIFHETWRDGDTIRARKRKLEFTLSADEYSKLRSAIRASGLLSIRSEFAGQGEGDWWIDVRTGDDLKQVYFDGGFPGEAVQLMKDAYEIIVVPRSAKMAGAEVFDPGDGNQAPEYQPLE